MLNNQSFFKFIKHGISFFFPSNNCIYCGDNSKDFFLCDKCIEIFMYVESNKKRCKKCGRELISEKNFCMECRDSPILMNIDFCLPLHSYILSDKEILHKWKNESERGFSLFFANLLYIQLQKNFPNIPIVPIPPRPKKIYKKGWDQINDIVNHLKKNKDIKVINILKRKTDIQQKKLSRDQRLSHKANIYQITDYYKKNKSLIPSKVVLLDDIITTGATLEYCGELLKKAGVKKVFAITIYSVD